MSLSDLPFFHAIINTAVAALLVAGYVTIKRGQRKAHERVMIAAVALSALFLASYVTYHFKHGSTKFAGEGIARPIYFTILLTHTILAVVNLPFVVMTFVRGLKKNFTAHVRIAKRTWAVWLYVAVTGPIVYVMLYQLYPPRRGPELAFAEAQALHRKDQDREALAKYREAAELGHLGARCYGAVIADRLDGTKTASAAITAALAEDPANLDCLTMSAREMVWQDRAREAIPIMEGVVKSAPSSAFFWASLGFAQFRGGRYANAATSFERSIALDPELPANVYNAGYAYFLDGDWPKAKPLMERALAMGLTGEPAERARVDLDVIAGKLFVCPMHPDEVGKPGSECSICGMKLARSPKVIAADGAGTPE